MSTHTTTKLTITARGLSWREALDGILARAGALVADFDVEELSITKTDALSLTGGRKIRSFYDAEMIARPLTEPEVGAAT